MDMNDLNRYVCQHCGDVFWRRFRKGPAPKTCSGACRKGLSRSGKQAVATPVVPRAAARPGGAERLSPWARPAYYGDAWADAKMREVWNQAGRLCRWRIRRDLAAIEGESPNALVDRAWQIWKGLPETERWALCWEAIEDLKPGAGRPPLPSLTRIVRETGEHVTSTDLL